MIPAIYNEFRIPEPPPSPASTQAFDDDGESDDEEVAVEPELPAWLDDLE